MQHFICYLGQINNEIIYILNTQSIHCLFYTSRDIENDIETAEVVVIKGTPAESSKDPAYVTGDIIAGDLTDDFPLYRVCLNGISIEKVEKMFTSLLDVCLLYTSSFLTFGVDPYADMIGKVLTGQYGMEEWLEGNYYKDDTSTVNHVDIFDMADKIDKLISSSFACIDEVREKAGLDRLNEEWSSRHLLTKNYEFIDKQHLQGGDKGEQSEDDDEV